MAQTGYTPISIYYSATTTNVPTAGNLVAGELAINTADGKLFYKDSSGVVQVIATKSATTVAGSNTQVIYNNAGAYAGSSNLTFDGTTLTANALKSATLGSPTATALTLQSAGSTAITVDTSQNVGIGTSIPQDKLSVYQANLGFVANSSGTGTNTINFRSSGNTIISQIKYDDSNGSLSLGTVGGGYPVIFNTNNTERMRIDSSGNVGIGTTSPSSYGQLAVYKSSGDVEAAVVTGSANYATYRVQNSTNRYSMQIRTDVSNAWVLRDETAGANRLVVDTSGKLLIGKTASNDTVVGIEAQPNGYFTCTSSSSSSAFTTLNVYSSGAGAYRFYVDMSGKVWATSTTISAISDERLKENVRDLDFGISQIMFLKPRRFDWKDGKGMNIKNAVGFIAQEFETVFPDSVAPSKAGEDGIEYKAITHEELIPTLVKAIQELNAKVTALEAQLATKG